MCKYINLIGNTPILRLKNYEVFNDLKARIYGKLEYFNPAGSVKDRVAFALIDDAERHGKLKANSVIVEPTSGNTGIGLASVAAVKGYEVILTMPDTMSIERQKLLKAYGAKIVLTDGCAGMAGSIETAKKILREVENCFMPNQFANFVNSKIHRLTTGPEIWNSTNGKVDFVVAGVGTGGTITGVGEYLKSRNKDVKIIAVEPAKSPVLSKNIAGIHKIQGIGAGFIPKILNTKIYDEIVCVEDEAAVETAKIIAKKEGIFVGISSGAALFAATKIAKDMRNEGKLIVVIFPDGGERYLSELKM